VGRDFALAALAENVSRDISAFQFVIYFQPLCLLTELDFHLQWAKRFILFTILCEIYPALGCVFLVCTVLVLT